MLALLGLRGSRKLKHRALSLYMGNGMRATVKAIKSFDLVLRSGLIIVLSCGCLYLLSKGSGERSGITLEVPDELVHKSSNEGAGVNLEVPDESKSSSSSSSFDYEVAVEDILSDDDEVTKKVDEVTEKADEVTKKAEKADDVKKSDVEKITDEQMGKEQLAKQ
ncbi:hypothetical protein Tco_0603589 [Tanacetum coccineum]